MKAFSFPALMRTALVILAGMPCLSWGADAPVAPTMAMEMILAKEEDAGPLAAPMQKLQEKIKANPGDSRSIEQLGRFFIAKARVNFDPGCYKLAEMCGVVLVRNDPKNAQGLLLQGETLLAMHRFHEAEGVARSLLAQRQDMTDHALLGDALMEQGRLDEAVQSYQAMIDAKPCLASYSRVAHMRWLRGDIEGATQMAEEAIACGSYRDPEPMAWVTARLSFYQWQDGRLEKALATAARACELVKDYPHALLVTGRVLLAQGKPVEAAAALEKTALKLPLPEVLWALADAARAAGQSGRAEAVEGRLIKSGAATDPRSFALYLATRHLQPQRALALSLAELETRADVHTYDALAWAQQAAGRLDEAAATMKKALAENTRDARLYAHAGLIANAAGDTGAASLWLDLAQAMRHALLPSELEALDHARKVSPAPPSRPDQPPQQVANQPAH
ncbi:MAG: tetratricopeptide repeat protein [Verrucomicrobiaceae bacterium]|nr:tetratricopeptide repeat protein [Verrucomicrobiaceae bacterium]